MKQNLNTLFEETKQNSISHSYEEILNSESNKPSSSRRGQPSVALPSPINTDRQLAIESDLSMVEPLIQSQIEVSLFKDMPRETLLRSPQLCLETKPIEQLSNEDDDEESEKLDIEKKISTREEEEEDFEALDSPAHKNIHDGDDFFVISSPGKQ